MGTLVRCYLKSTNPSSGRTLEAVYIPNSGKELSGTVQDQLSPLRAVLTEFLDYGRRGEEKGARDQIVRGGTWKAVLGLLALFLDISFPGK